MPEFDLYHLAFPLAIVVIAAFSFQYQRGKIDREFWELNKELNEARSKLVELEAEKATGPKSQDLKDFLKDIDTKGYGIVRIDPDDLFYRGRS
jgi:hypothetical protein